MSQALTPSPWYATGPVNNHDQALVISEATGQTVAVAYNGMGDAQLMAAAPDLLAALEMAEGVVYRALDNGHPVDAIHCHILNAIAKAKGGA